MSAPSDSPDTLSRLFEARDRNRRDLLRYLAKYPDNPSGIIVENVDIRSEAFERVLPELQEYAQRRQVEELSTSVRNLKSAATDLTSTTTTLAGLTRALLVVAGATLAVGIVAIAVALIR